jgi:hypothetical protein
MREYKSKVKSEAQRKTGKELSKKTCEAVTERVFLSSETSVILLICHQTKRVPDDKALQQLFMFVQHRARTDIAACS